MQPFDRHSLSTYCVPSTVLGTRDAAGNKGDKNPSFGTGNRTESPGCCECVDICTELRRVSRHKSGEDVAGGVGTATGRRNSLCKAWGRREFGSVKGLLST